MVVSAARISPRLLVALQRADDGKRPIAEVWRAVGATAERLGQPRPSYECVRLVVTAERRRRAEPTTTEVMVDVALRSRPPDALLDHVAGIGVPRR
jgi:hypothetical protein